jgi:hypothetical protein
MHKNIAVPNNSTPMADLNSWFDLKIKKGIMEKAVEYRVILGVFSIGSISAGPTHQRILIRLFKGYY